MKPYTMAISGLVCVLMLSGCRHGGTLERYGKTYYLEGAGNWGFGTQEMIDGLRWAGYSGDIEVFPWTTSLIPLVDHVNICGAKCKAQILAKRIARYRERYPDNHINVVALSSGTGVATWAVERLQDDVHIDNMVFLSSSLSNEYDVGKALSHMNGRIYVFYSASDAVLKTVSYFPGTMDWQYGVECAGLVGLTPPEGHEHRVVNIPWTRDWSDYGWKGGHLGWADPSFIRVAIAPHLTEHMPVFGPMGIENNAWAALSQPVHYQAPSRATQSPVLYQRAGFQNSTHTAPSTTSDR